MKYCAVAVKTESGDLYSFLVQYEQVDEVPVRIHDWMDEELAYVYEMQVDSGVDADTDDEIKVQIQNFIDNMEK